MKKSKKRRRVKKALESARLINELNRKLRTNRQKIPQRLLKKRFTRHIPKLAPTLQTGKEESVVGILRFSP
ncbi:MAG: hypothetical protein AAF212_11390 [Verrucomicrobiota bacterium]